MTRKVCDNKYSFHSCRLQSSEQIIRQTSVNFIKPIFMIRLGQIGALTVQVTNVAENK